MRKLILFLIAFFFIINLIHAEIETLGAFKTNSCIDLIQTCSNCTYVNLTSVKYPNSSTALNNIEMTKDESEYNYTFCSTGLNGEYIVNGIGDVDGINTVFAYNFIVNPLGEITSTGKSIMYIVLTLIILFFFLVLTYITLSLPFNPSRNSRQEIIFIPKIKYLKLGLILICYALFIWMLNLLIGISNSFLTLSMYYSFLEFLFNFFMNLSYPLFIFIIIIMGYHLVKDIDFNKQIKKFGSVKNG